MTYQVGDTVRLLSFDDVIKKYPPQPDGMIVIPNKANFHRHGLLACKLGQEVKITARSTLAGRDWIIELIPSIGFYPPAKAFISEEMIECKIYPPLNINVSSFTLAPLTLDPMPYITPTVLAPEICPCCGQCKLIDAMSAITKREYKQCKLCGWKS